MSEATTPRPSTPEPAVSEPGGDVAEALDALLLRHGCEDGDAACDDCHRAQAALNAVRDGRRNSTLVCAACGHDRHYYRPTSASSPAVSERAQEEDSELTEAHRRALREGADAHRAAIDVARLQHIATTLDGLARWEAMYADNADATADDADFLRALAARLRAPAPEETT